MKINGLVIVRDIVQWGGRHTLGAHPRVALPPRPTRLGQREVGEIHGGGGRGGGDGRDYRDDGVVEGGGMVVVVVVVVGGGGGGGHTETSVRCSPTRQTATRTRLILQEDTLSTDIRYIHDPERAVSSFPRNPVELEDFFSSHKHTDDTHRYNTLGVMATHAANTL